MMKKILLGMLLSMSSAAVAADNMDDGEQAFKKPNLTLGQAPDTTVGTTENYDSLDKVMEIRSPFLLNLKELEGKPCGLFQQTMVLFQDTINNNLSYYHELPYSTVQIGQLANIKENYEHMLKYIKFCLEYPKFRNDKELVSLIHSVKSHLMEWGLKANSKYELNIDSSKLSKSNVSE